MSVVEFATISLKPGVSSSDPELQSALRDCLKQLKAAKGAINFRFLRSSARLHPNVKESERIDEVLALLGCWATVEDHAGYLRSGQADKLLSALSPFIELRDMVHLYPDAKDGALKKVLVGPDLVSSSFRVQPKAHGCFTRFVEDMKADDDVLVVGGWRIKKKGKFREAEELAMEQLGQPTEAKEKDGDGRRDSGVQDERAEEDDVWTDFGLEGEEELVEVLRWRVEMEVDGSVERTEVWKWETFVE